MNKINPQKFKGFITNLGDIIRLSFGLLLVVFLVILVWHAISPISVQTRVSLDYFLLTVITFAILSFLLPRAEEAESEVVVRRRPLWVDIALSFTFAIVVGFAAWYSLRDTRLAVIIASITGLLAMMFPLLYLRRM